MAFNFDTKVKNKTVDEKAEALKKMPVVKPKAVTPLIKSVEQPKTKTFTTVKKTTPAYGTKGYLPKDLPVRANPFMELANVAALRLPENIIPGYKGAIEQAKKESPIATTVAGGLGYLVPGVASAKAVQPLLGKVGSKVVKNVTEGAIVGTGITAAENVVPLLKGEKDIRQVGKEIAIGAATGAIADVGLYGLGKLAKPLLSKIAKGQTLSQSEKQIVAKQAKVSVDNVDKVVENYRKTIQEELGLPKETTAQQYKAQVEGQAYIDKLRKDTELALNQKNKQVMESFKDKEVFYRGEMKASDIGENPNILRPKSINDILNKDPKVLKERLERRIQLANESIILPNSDKEFYKNEIYQAKKQLKEVNDILNQQNIREEASKLPVSYVTSQKETAELYANQAIESAKILGYNSQIYGDISGLQQPVIRKFKLDQNRRTLDLTKYGENGFANIDEIEQILKNEFGVTGEQLDKEIETLYNSKFYNTITDSMPIYALLKDENLIKNYKRLKDNVDVIRYSEGNQDNFAILNRNVMKEVADLKNKKLNIKHFKKERAYKKQTLEPLLSDTQPQQQTFKPLLDTNITEPLTDVTTQSMAFKTGVEETSIPLPKQSIESKIPQSEKPVFENYRKTVHNSFINSNMDEEAKNFFKENPETYTQVTNQDTWDKAYSKVAENFEDTKKTFEAKTSLETADDTAEAIAIMHKLSEQGKTNELIDFTRKMSEKATDAGRAVQAISLLQRSTPEGKLLQATNVVKNAVKQLEETDNALFEKLKKNGKLPKLTEEDADFILDTMRKAQNLEGREKQIAIARADQLISDKIPVSLGDKVRALRNLSLLGNPKTLAVRNPLGNLIFSGLENVSQIPSGITDTMISAILKTGRQTPVLPSVGTQLKGFKKGVREAAEDIVNNVDTSPTRGGAELPRNRKVFETAWLNKANNWLGDSLKMGDRPFYQAAYEQRLSELQKLQPNAKIEDLEKLADSFGKERTFQNDSMTAQGARALKEGFNKLNVGGFGLGDVVMPYTQTPANIIAKGAEYTPLGLIKLGKIAYGGKKGIADNQKVFTDTVGRLFTGSGLAALGYSLAANGYITGKDTSTSSKVKALNKEAGQQQYSIKIGDTWYSFDWAQPASIPLALGVDFYNAGLKETDVASKLSKGLISAGDTLTNQSFLQGITRMFGGKSPTEGVVSSLAQLPAQFIPTLSNQAAQVSDPYKREADYSGFIPEVKTTIAKRIPGARQTLEPSIDIYGEKMLEQQGRPAIEKAISVFLSTSLTSKETKDPLTKELYRLYQSTKESGVIPKKEPPEGLTKKQETAFKIDMGKTAKPKLSSIVNSSVYRNSSDEKKAKLLERAIEEIYRTVKDRNKPTQ